MNGSAATLNVWLLRIEVNNSIRSNISSRLYRWPKDLLEELPFLRGETFRKDSSERRSPGMRRDTEKDFPRSHRTGSDIDMKLKMQIDKPDIARKIE